MDFLKKIRDFFAERPKHAVVDFSRLSRNKKVKILEREAREFDKKYGQVIKKLAHE